MTVVLDYRRYLRYMLPDSMSVEQLLANGPAAGGVYGLVVECIEDAEYVQRVCALIRRAKGTVRLIGLSAAQPAAPPAPPSAFAGTMRPTDGEPLLKASGDSAWYTALLSHLFLSARPKQHLVLWGAPGVGKSLALQRARAMAVSKAVPHLFVSAAADGDGEADFLLEARQFFATTGAHGDALFVIDDVEAFTSVRRATQLLTMMAAARARCVLVCNDSYAEQVRALHRRPERYRFLEATRVTEDALAAHLRLKFPQLARLQVDGNSKKDVYGELAAQARGDVRAAQLAAELEVGALRGVARIEAKLQRAGKSSALRAPLVAALGALQQRAALTTDDQQHGSLTGDILRCVRAKVSAATPWWQRSRGVVRACDMLLQPRAVDAAETMQSNYARLCGDDELDMMARMADDVSSAFAYRGAIVDGMMADKFSRYRPDDSMDDNFKDQLVFDMAVVAPCVRASRGDVGRDASRTLKLEFPEMVNRRQAMQLSAACRRLEVRHEVLVRTTASLIDSSGDDVRPEVREKLEQRALESASVRLTTSTAYYAQRPRASASGVEASEPQAAQDDGDGKRSGGTTSISIDRLERTLFVFTHLVARADMRVVEQRKAAIARCAAYGYDAEMYARAALLYGFCANEAEGREQFASAGTLVLDQNHRATAVLRTEIGARANTTVTAVAVTGPMSSAGIGTAAGSKQSATAGGGKSAGKRKAAESSAVQKHSAPAPTFMDKYLSTVARSKGGKI